MINETICDVQISHRLVKIFHFPCITFNPKLHLLRREASGMASRVILLTIAHSVLGVPSILSLGANLNASYSKLQETQKHYRECQTGVPYALLAMLIWKACAPLPYSPVYAVIRSFHLQYLLLLKKPGGSSEPRCSMFKSSYYAVLKLINIMLI